MSVVPESRTVADARQVEGQGHHTRKPLWPGGFTFVKRAQMKVARPPWAEQNGLGRGCMLPRE